MLVILAGAEDQTAQALVRQWAAHDAALLTSRDLSVAGWKFFPNRAQPSRAVIGHQVVEGEAVEGVLTRLGAVAPADLVDILAADQAYVAAEMTAFLVAWLSSLHCPVLNRPTPTCLGGPGWRTEHWLYAAGQIDIPVRDMSVSHDRGPLLADPATVSVTVVGDRCFGNVHDVLAGHARRLAEAAGVDLLDVHFSGSDPSAVLLGASPWPDIGPDIEQAVLECLLEERRC